MKIAVIPARGGSKRIPRKNIKPFAGRPMLTYAVSAALDTGLFSAIVVSSDDAEILECASALGATPLSRPEALADDWTPTVPVIAHAITAIEGDIGQPEIVCCMYPAVPFLRRQDIVETLSLLERTNGKYAFPIVRFPSPIQRALRLGQEGVLAPFFPEATSARSQDLEPGYYDAGQFYWGWRDAWLSGAPIHPNGHGFVIPEWRAIDIDTPDDWRRAEWMHAALAKQGDAD